MKLSCCMIVRDDASTLRACLESIRPHVDELVVLDTGSSDASPEIAREFDVKWDLFLGCNDEGNRIDDFAMARNKSFSLATGDVVCWFDADDVVKGGEHLRAIAEGITADNARVLLPYEYARDAQGRCTTLQYRERVMRPPHGLEWQSPVHEVCAFKEPTEGTVSETVDERVRVIHCADQSTKVREPGRNLRILEKYIRRIGESDPRALYYLGSELARAGEPGRALRALKRYTQIEGGYIFGSATDQRCKAMLEVGNIYAGWGDWEQAEEWFLKALTTRRWPDAYFALGGLYYLMAQPAEMLTGRMTPNMEYNLRRAANFLDIGVRYPDDPLLFTNPAARGEAHVYLNACLGILGDTEGAISSCEAGLSVLPDDPRLLQNLVAHRTKDLESKTYVLIEKLREAGRITEGQELLMRATLKGDLAVETERPVEAVEQHDLPAQTAEPGKLDVALFLGPALEHWTPDTWAKTGMGGSETMAWEMARRLRKLGHRVRVYTHCTPAQEGAYEGVEWLQWQRFKGVHCDVLLVSRYPFAVDDEFACKATAKLLWVHDVHCGDMLDMRRATRFDRILCLSEWHKRHFVSCYQGLDADKVHVTRNGIDLTRFEGTEESHPHRAIYSSSPDRGLLAAVMAWPRIREQVPDAELHCFYGFGNWEASARQMNDQAQLGQIAHLKQLCRSTPGVVMRDRVNQRELAREFMRAGVWLYPTWFSETSCITAMEAQAAGCAIVYSPIAALVETVRSGHPLEAKWDYPAAPSPEFIADAVACTVREMRAMADPDYTQSHVARQRAKAFSLDTLAEDWDEMLLALHSEQKESVMPKFKEVAAQ